jgi:hypothetical protein
MPSVQMPLLVHSYKLRSTPASTARLLNCSAIKLPPEAKTRVLLMRSAGPRIHAMPGTGPLRGQHTFQGNVFVVSGTSLYEVDIAGNETLIGSIPGTGSVSMAHNIDTLVIVAEPNAYYTDGVTVSQITDVDFTARGAKYVEFLDNFLVFMEADSGRVFWADVGEADDFDSLNFATAEGDPDDLVGIKSDHRQILLLGEASFEIFEFTENGLVRAINGYGEVGCANGDTAQRFDNSVAWVAPDFSVRVLRGNTPQIISEDSISQFLSSVDVSTLRAYSYSLDGGFYYVVCCSAGARVYNGTTQQWHELSTYPNDYFAWQYQCTAHGRQYIGNFYTNELAYFDPTHYKDGNGIQRMEGTFQPVYAQNRLAVHHRVELVFETGVGLTLGQGSDPEVMLSYSKDGGITWTNLPNKKLGKMGDYEARVHWDAVCSGRQVVYRFAVSDPVKVALTDAFVYVTGAAA